MVTLLGPSLVEVGSTSQDLERRGQFKTLGDQNKIVVLNYFFRIMYYRGWPSLALGEDGTASDGRAQ